ncbi:hypothetical protein J2Z83_001444 [Virgibacillus natechei]|uniref:Uncharacterized protein n=1 Tax=Virgibacillus natechei TaxID=1216297 RepID=A0ABS4IEG7_9BACI|nr:hypothetical protein [Virgibacillus natechei]MBP1969340.1 hypothetical protein [Virgibacillus natechei]UZD12489.1 hypothetical protein OLD84_16520 [Virgibacillus natechei]
MSPSQRSSYSLFKQSEKEYMKFFNTLFQMLLSYVQTMAFCPSLPADKKYAEQQLIVSLNLIEKMVMHLYWRDLWLENQKDADSNNSMDGEINEMENLISELTFYIKRHNFVRYSDKQQCTQLLDQLSRYLSNNHVRIIIKNPVPAKPWINSILLQGFYE